MWFVRYLPILPVVAGLLNLMLAGVGCDVRPPQTYRMVSQERSCILVPPAVAAVAVSRAVFATAVASWRPACAPPGTALVIQPRRNKVRVTVARDALLQAPPGWLSHWTATAEAEGCL